MGVFALANGRPGAPRKPDSQKKTTYHYTIDQSIGDQLVDDAHYMGETASSIVTGFAQRYHELTEDIEVRKLKLQQKKVEIKRLEAEIDEDEKSIQDLECIIKHTGKRVDDPAYMADYQRVVDRLVQYPKEQKHIYERATVLANNHGYYKPYILKDLKDAIARANGNYTKESKKEHLIAEGLV
jgi:hypothetical protein